MENNFYNYNAIQNNNINSDIDETWALQYAEQLLDQEIREYSDDHAKVQQRNQVQQILQIFLTRRQDVLELIETYGVPRRISRFLTARIIRFVLQNAAQVTGSLEQKTQELFRRFLSTDNVVVPILRVFGVPFNTTFQFIRRVIRVTLRNIVTIPPIPPSEPDINERVRQIANQFEQRYPNFLGLTNVYGIPIGVARNITRDIIRFTLLNINRIPDVGTIQQRADAMLRLLDQERPDLIRQMIRRGVPAGQAESIARQMILFTLNRLPMFR